MLLLPVAFGGFFDKFFKNENQITGRATSGNVSVSLTLGNNNPIIYWVTTGLTPSPTENSTTNVIFNFYVNDSDGCENINPSTAIGNVQNLSVVTRSNLSCTDMGCIGSYGRNFSCTVKMWYFDNATSYTINVSIADMSSSSATNTSSSLDYASLTSMASINTSLTFSGITAGSTNSTAANNITILNIANKALVISINATDLIGQSDGAYVINATSFKMNNTGTGCIGKTLTNGTDTTLTGIIAYNGNVSAGQGTQNIVTCLTDIPATHISQVYTASRPWYITVS